jgi:hypothetical protein
VQLLDISDGGALIEAPTLWKPGEREVFVLRGDNAVKVAGRVLRVEVTRLAPSICYRSAVQFGTPVTLSSLWSSSKVTVAESQEVREEFSRVFREVLSVHAVRVASALVTRRDMESVHFAVPNQSSEQHRMLQVFFAPGSLPTPEEFKQLRRLAVLASGLEDLEIVRTDVASSSPRRALVTR